MGAFKRRKKSPSSPPPAAPPLSMPPPPPPAAPPHSMPPPPPPGAPAAMAPPVIPGVPSDAAATHDFDVVVRRLITQMAPDGTTLIDTGHDSIRAGEYEVNLVGLRNTWLRTPAGDREIGLRNALHGVFLSELRHMDTLDHAMLRPGIRTQAQLDLAALTVAIRVPGTTQRHDIVARPLATGLCRVLFWDTNATRVHITVNQLEDWGADFEELWTIAVQNLAGVVTTPGWESDPQSRLWVPNHLDEYMGERLFIDGYLEQTGLEGEAVIFIPSRTCLLVADPSDPLAVQRGAKYALKHANDRDAALSHRPYIGKGTTWRPLELPDDHLAANDVAILTGSERALDYAKQQELLVEADTDDVFIATYMVYEKPGRTFTTIATWGKDVVSLLPRAELIAFATGDKPTDDQFFVEWDTAHAIVGDRLQPTEHRPERWFVDSFPSPAELEQLRAAHQLP